MNKRIPIFKLKYEDTFINKFNLLSKKIFKSPSLSEGSFVSSFENKFANFVKANYAVAVTNGTAALEIAFRIIGINNKEVILASFFNFVELIILIFDNSSNEISVNLILLSSPNSLRLNFNSPSCK